MQTEKGLRWFGMPDRESVITHLQIIHTWAEFARERDLQFFTPKHLEDIAQWSDDALNLLKEQESVEPEIQTGSGVSWWYICGNCKTALNPKDKFCHECGRRIKWERT